MKKGCHPTGPPKLRTISLGAGVQSTTMALLAKHGELTPMPDCALFADTQSEPAEVYRHLDWLEPLLPFPVHRVTAGNLHDHLVAATTGSRFAGVPFFTETPRGTGRGILRRQCTREFKLDPMKRKIRELLGAAKGQRLAGKVTVEQWIGISTDEASRMKPSRDAWLVSKWPLIDLGMSRADCLRWLTAHGYPTPPKSACTFCPFHSDVEWRRIRDTQPDEWTRVIALDRLVRHGVTGTKERVYLHDSLKPLEDVDLSTAAERGQGEFRFVNECEGMCGV